MPSQFRLTASETQLLMQDPRIWANLPVDLGWLPYKQIPDAYTLKDYELRPIEPPAGSRLGEHAWGVQTAKAETERDIISLRYQFGFNKTDMRIAARNNYALLRENLRAGTVTINKWIAKILFQGTEAIDRVNISGMLDVGEDIAGSAYTWNTAAQPTLCVLEAVTDLLDNNYAPPYQMIMSWNLFPGFAALHDAAGAFSHAELAERNYQATVATYAHNGTSAITAGLGWQIYPLPAAATTDGIFIMCKVDPENFYMGQVSSGIEISPLVFNPRANHYEVFMEWRGTPVFRGATVDTAGSAEYIVFEPDVNLA